LGNLSHKYKIVIAGNHELSFDEIFREKAKQKKSAEEEDGISSTSLHYGGRGGNDAKTAFSVSRYIIKKNPRLQGNFNFRTTYLG
jgi:hypothetical protein